MSAGPSTLRIDFPRVRLFRADGPAHVYDRGKVTARSFSEQDLDEAVRNFRLLCMGEQPVLRPPLGPGHPESYHPAWGRVSNLWREGNGLYGTLANVDPDVARDMDEEKWLSLSVEFYDSPEQAEIPEYLRRGASGLLLRRVGLFGAVPPRVKGLGNPPWEAGEPAVAGWNLWDHPPRYTASERGKTMPNEEQMAVAKAAGFGDGFLSTLKDDQLMALVTDLAGRALGVQSGAGTETPATPAAGEGDMSRDQMISELVSMGEDQATLEQMDDASLKELYAQKKGGAPAAPAPTTMGEGAGRRVSAPAGLSPHAIRQYVQATAKTEVERGRKDERVRQVNATVDSLVGKKLTPAEAGTAEKPGPVRKQLLRASAHYKFGEEKSELEMQIEALQARPDVRHFGELIADPHQGGGPDPFTERVKKHYEQELARLNRN
jgi:hypothetical protein